jgi:hypothetical protein
MKNKLLLLFLTVSAFSFAQNCSELFISEYVEGTANNKAIEIYNPTNAAIDLSQYIIARYANGASSATISNAIQLSGTIAANDVFVAVLDKRDPNGTGQEAPIWDSLEVKADGFYCPVYTTSNAFYWSGNDAVVLFKGILSGIETTELTAISPALITIDIFGKIGEDPGPSTGWSTDAPYNNGAGLVVTQNHTLIRKANINGGVNVNPNSFIALTEWDSLPNNTFSNLGTHTCDCFDPNPPTASILSGSATICNGDSINLSISVTGTPLPSGGQPTYYVTLTDGLNNFSAIGTSPIIIQVAPTIISTFSIVSVMTLGGGVGTGNSGTATVIVIPTISNTINASICEGTVYTWNNQDYTYSGTFTQTFPAANGCDSIVTLNLTVNANDYIQIQAIPAFGNSPLNVAFNNQTANLANYNFTWYFGDGTSQQSNSPFLSHTYTQDAYSDVTVVAENTATGCITSNLYNDMIFVIGGVSCTHTATLNQTGPLSACVGDSVLLSCNTDPSFSYQWNRNGVPVSGATSSSIYAQLSGSYTVTIYQNNCPVTSNGISVTINPLPSIPTITSTGTITSCFGGSLTLSAPAGLSSYSWNTGSIAASINVTLSGNYTVTVTNASGCARTSAPYVVNASFMSSPNVCIVGMDSLTNENRIVWEKPITTGIDSFYVYKETNVSDVYTKIGATNYPDLAVFLDQNSNPAVQAYRYKLTVLDTCGTETLLSDFHKTIHLTINAGVGGAWNLIWSNYEGLTFGSYNIYRGTDPTNISLLTTIQSNLNSYTDLTPPVGPVYYQIEIVNPNSCDPAKVVNYDVSKSNIVNNGVNGINALASTAVLVYPNPTSKDVTLEITAELLEKDYYLTDNTGRIILSGQFRTLKETINLEQISTGVYFIKIDDNANLMYKIVKN